MTLQSLPVSLLANGIKITGWKTVRITRGIERIPSDFEVSMTDNLTGVDQIIVGTGDPFVLKIGNFTVMTGYIDRVVESMTPSEHALTISGRGKCQDLVDCSAIFDTFQFLDVFASDIAKKLAKPFSIEVALEAKEEVMFSQVCLNVGETPFAVIDRYCKISNLLCYENEDGKLVIGQVSEDMPSSGFKQGVNVQQASYLRDASNQFSEYRVYPVGNAILTDVGQLPFSEFTYKNELVKRTRVKSFIQMNNDPGAETSNRHAVWECNRRIGRGNVIALTTDSWVDSNGQLYKPNTQVSVSLPKLKVQENQKWVIAEVTYRLGMDGTNCDLVLMPPEAFKPEPIIYLILPNDVDAALKVAKGV